MKDREFEVGDIVVVHNRSLFAVPVKGRVTDISSNGALQVFFFNDNPGGQNVTKFDGTYFRRQHCRLITGINTTSAYLFRTGNTAYSFIRTCPETFQKKKVKKVCERWVNIDKDGQEEDYLSESIAKHYAEIDKCITIKLTGEYEVEE